MLLGYSFDSENRSTSFQTSVLVIFMPIHVKSDHGSRERQIQREGDESKELEPQSNIQD